MYFLFRCMKAFFHTFGICHSGHVFFPEDMHLDIQSMVACTLQTVDLYPKPNKTTILLVLELQLHCILYLRNIPHFG